MRLCTGHSLSPSRRQQRDGNDVQQTAVIGLSMWVVLAAAARGRYRIRCLRTNTVP